jgi:hypothetical protein
MGSLARVGQARSRVARLAGVLLLAVAPLVSMSCASGGDIETSTGSGGAAASSGNEAGPETGAGPTSGQGGDPMGPSGPGATSSTGPQCSEQPCKLLPPQCGCGAGEQCTIDASGDRVCGPQGSVAPGQICDAGALCAGGSICIGYPDYDSSCASICETDADCEAPGGKCLVEIASLPGITLCTDDCEPISSQGCNVPGLACQVGVAPDDTPYTGCAPSGAGNAGDVCADSSECSPGLVCLPTTASDQRCFAWCNVASPNCSDLTCKSLDVVEGVPLVIGNVQYGVCSS